MSCSQKGAYINLRSRFRPFPDLIFAALFERGLLSLMHVLCVERERCGNPAAPLMEQQ